MKKTRLFALALAALLLLACIGCAASSKSAAYDTAASEPQYAMTEEAVMEMPAEAPAPAETEGWGIYPPSLMSSFRRSPQPQALPLRI